MTEPYTLTGASDWYMMVGMIGGFSLFFYGVVIVAIKGWIAEVTTAIKQLVIAVAAREVAEQKLKNEVLMQMNSIGMSFTLAIDTAFDKLEKRAHSSLQEHVAQQETDINRMFADLREHKAWTHDAIKDCHEKRDHQWDKMQKLMDDCQGECCPRGKG
jgi:myo-inositol-1-phosphate synthase